MKINVRIFGDLTTILGHRHVVELDEGSTISILANRIAEKHGTTRQGYLGRYKVGGSDLAVLVNGRNIHLLDGSDTVLHDGDEVVILPPAAGG
jgi:MoaD family protein